MTKRILRLIPISILLLLLVLIIIFKLYRYFTLDNLQHHREFLITWTSQHRWLAVLIYMGIYSFMVAISSPLPGAAFLTMVGGFLFGTYWGTLFVVISATVGAMITFVAAKTAFAELLKEKAGSRIKNMRAGFQKNALSYLFSLRLVPIFPFWLVNIVSALLNVPFRIFFIATFFGIIPASFIYVSLGNGLSEILASNKPLHLNIIFQPHILLPLLGLAILSFLPVLYKKIKKPSK